MRYHETIRKHKSRRPVSEQSLNFLDFSIRGGDARLNAERLFKLQKRGSKFRERHKSLKDVIKSYNWSWWRSRSEFTE